MDKYVRQRVIGKGSYGQAVVVKRKADGALLVLKEVRLQGLKMEERREARAECELLSRLKHPNIVQYQEHFEQRQVLYIAMEFAERGDLDGMLKKYQKQHGYTGRGLPQEQALHYLAQICMAMRYLHEKKILHRDIKCANIFLTASNVVKIGDFGISTILRNTFALARTVCGTPYYFSPELCQNRPYNNKSDVWAIGCVFYELLTLRHPFDGQNMKQLMQRIVRGTPAPVSTAYEKEVRELATAMLQKSDKQRPNVGQVLAMPVMRGALERLQQGLGVATTKKEKLPNFREMLQKNAQVHPAAPARVQHRAQRPVGVSPKAAGQVGQLARGDPKRVGGAPGQRVGAGIAAERPGAQDVIARREREKALEQQIAERKREAELAEKRLEQQIAEKAKEVARWHRHEQAKARPEPLAPREAEARGGGAQPRGRGDEQNPSNRRRLSAPVTSPTSQPLDLFADRRAQASPRASNSDGQGRRRAQLNQLDPAPLAGRGVEAEKKSKEVAVNNLLLHEMPSKEGDSRPSSGAPSPVPVHGRRATHPEGELASHSKFVEGQGDGAAENDDGSGEDATTSDDEPETEQERAKRNAQYKEMLVDIDKALTQKPGGGEDFEDAIDCPPAAAAGGIPGTAGGDPQKFMLGGATLRLNIAKTAPLTERLEVLRVYLAEALGHGLLLKAYKMVSELDTTEEVLQSVATLLGPQKDKVPLICQLAYCDDQVNLNQS